MDKPRIRVLKEVIEKLSKSFEESAHSEQGIEYWMARDLQDLLEYDKWANFLNVIEKAKIACQNSSGMVTDHFADVGKIVHSGIGGHGDMPEIVTILRF